MTERWQKQLQKLREIEPPADGWQRAETRDPSGDGLPPPRQRVVAGIVAFAVFAAAGLLLVRTFDRDRASRLSRDTPAGTSHLVVTTAAPDDRDEISFGSITLTIDGVTTAGVGGSAGTTPLGEGGEAPEGYPNHTLEPADFVPLAAGSTLGIRGDADIVETTVSVGKDLEHPEVVGDNPNILPTLPPGYYVLRIEARWTSQTTETWKSLYFPIELAPTEGVPSDVLRIRCDREGTTTVLTPFVAAQVDGVRVVVLPVGTAQPVAFREPGSDSSFGGTISADGESHSLPIAPGPIEVECGPDVSGFEGAARFEVVDPAGHWADTVPACDETGTSEVVGYDGGAVEWIDEPAAIRGILRGVLPEDRVMQPLYGRDRLDRWLIVRDGDVVAVLNYFPVTDVTDPRGGGLGRVTGDVCRSSGIAGTVPPRDPDEDGVDLDCRAESQVAFRHHDGYLLPAGEAFVRANVPGIRSTDELVPPVEGGGDDGLHGVWKVMREGKAVASINYPAVDGITCRFNAIGTVESV